MINRILGALVLLGLAALLVMGWLHRTEFTPVETGIEAPDFELPRLDGTRVSLRAQRGNVVVLNLWATWCVPCRVEMPALERLHQKLASRGLQVLAVSLDAGVGKTDDLGNPGGDVADFVKEYNLTMPVLLDPAGTVRQKYGIAGLPTTYIIDRNGIVREKKLGPAHWDQSPWIDRITELLDE